MTRLALGRTRARASTLPSISSRARRGWRLRLPLDALVGPCFVVAAADVDGELQPDALDEVPAAAERVLLRTRNAELWACEGFVEDSVCLSAALAADVVRRGIRLVGIDYLAIGGLEARGTCSPEASSPSRDSTCALSRRART